MNKDEIRTKVFKVVADVMEVPLSEINDHSSSETIETWDSMTQMALTLALQEEFKVKLPSAQASKLSKVNLIVSALEDVLK